MSGHSKWAQIKRQKGAADAKRSSLFTKFSNAISAAARVGGENPETNFKLRLAIERAKAANMPNQSIERAIARGVGKAEGAAIEEVFYEGFGPGGIPLVIETVTDNKNRTSGEIRSVLTRYGGSLGTPNSVRWQFEQAGLIFLAKESVVSRPRDELELQLIEAGAEDVKDGPEGLTVYTKPAQLKTVQEKVDALQIPVAAAELVLVPKNPVTAPEEEGAKLCELVAELEGRQDVNAVYTNLAE